MSVPAYPSYRDSGVKWLGDVPSHWSIVRLRWALMAAPCYGVLVPDHDPYGIAMMRITDMEQGKADRASFATISPALSEQYERTVLASGDLALSVVGTIGRSLIVDKTLEGVNISRAIARLRFNERCKAGFARWFFESMAFQTYIDLVCTGTAQRVLNMDDLSAIRLSFPSIQEQGAIAAFLDRETAKIDALVEEQRRLVELLTEKRQAFVSHAVTRGLDPTVPMKDSGVEWLGEVPAHWEVAPLKRFLTVLSGYAFPSQGFSTSSHDERLLRGINVGVGQTRWDEVVYWPRSSGDGLDAFELRAGDIVLGMDRPWIGEGLRVAQLTEQDVPALLLQRVVALRPSRDLSQRFLLHLLRGGAFHHHCVPEMSGVSVPHISPSQVCDFAVAVPPREEQDKITCEVDAASQKAADLIEEAETAITLLQERRSALISAAVTGKIDVRGLVPISSQVEAA